MTKPRTEAGKKLHDKLCAYRGTVCIWHPPIRAIEAEATHAVLAAVRERVVELPKDRGDASWSTVSRNAVLAILDDLEKSDRVPARGPETAIPRS